MSSGSWNAGHRGPRCLNLGCGERFHQDWVNVDFVATAPGIRAHDLREGIPYPDTSFDVVYHSHLLEHFPKEGGARFLQECFRVLKMGGIIRVAVPDLEQIARLYVEALDKSMTGDRVWQDRYEWMLLEMYDQTVRNSSGGDMLAHLKREPIPEKEFVESRFGGEIRRIMADHAERTAKGPEKISSRVLNLASRKIARLMLGRRGIQAHDLGVFRLSGEVHHWMYDRYSLGKALEKAGFRSPRRMGAAESAVPDWASFHLDTEPDGRVYKPDSVYMEATRE